MSGNCLGFALVSNTSHCEEQKTESDHAHSEKERAESNPAALHHLAIEGLRASRVEPVKDVLEVVGSCLHTNTSTIFLTRLMVNE